MIDVRIPEMFQLTRNRNHLINSISTFISSFDILTLFDYTEEDKNTSSLNSNNKKKKYLANKQVKSWKHWKMSGRKWARVAVILFVPRKRDKIKRHVRFGQKFHLTKCTQMFDIDCFFSPPLSLFFSLPPLLPLNNRQLSYRLNEMYVCQTSVAILIPTPGDRKPGKLIFSAFCAGHPCNYFMRLWNTLFLASLRDYSIKCFISALYLSSNIGHRIHKLESSRISYN